MMRTREPCADWPTLIAMRLSEVASVRSRVVFDATCCAEARAPAKMKTAANASAERAAAFRISLFMTGSPDGLLPEPHSDIWISSCLLNATA
jgi:hypothetical protein